MFLNFKLIYLFQVGIGSTYQYLYSTQVWSGLKVLFLFKSIWIDIYQVRVKLSSLLFFVWFVINYFIIVERFFKKKINNDKQSRIKHQMDFNYLFELIM
jgi:hypothetical protein